MLIYNELRLDFLYDLPCLQANGITNTTIAVTRSHKTTDRDHAGLANGTAVPEDNLPKYFGKAGYAGESPSKTKKQGGGKSNW
jgi:hypothetical protein